MAVPGSGQLQRMPVPLRALSAVAVIPHEFAAAQRWVVNRCPVLIVAERGAEPHESSDP